MSERRRATYLTVSQAYDLRLACRPLWEAGFSTYLVGSVLHRADYRDVDIRAMLADEHYDAMIGNHPARLRLLNVSMSEWLQARTGLPIDFQYQRRTEANARFPYERHPIGLPDPPIRDTDAIECPTCGLIGDPRLCSHA